MVSNKKPPVLLLEGIPITLLQLICRILRGIRIHQKKAGWPHCIKQQNNTQFIAENNSVRSFAISMWIPLGNPNWSKEGVIVCLQETRK